MNWGQLTVSNVTESKLGPKQRNRALIKGKKEMKQWCSDKRHCRTVVSERKQCELYDWPIFLPEFPVRGTGSRQSELRVQGNEDSFTGQNPRENYTISPGDLQRLQFESSGDLWNKLALGRGGRKRSWNSHKPERKILVIHKALI